MSIYCLMYIILLTFNSSPIWRIPHLRFIRITFLLPVLTIVGILQAQIINEHISYGDRLKLGFVFTKPVQFNPLLVETSYEREFKKLVFGFGLFSRTQDGIIQPAIAVSSVQEDARSWLIHIRSNVIFHDQSVLDAEDIRFTFGLYKKFALQSPDLFTARLISTIDILDPHTIRIVFRQPVENFRETLGLLPILPAGQGRPDNPPARIPVLRLFRLVPDLEFTLFNQPVNMEELGT